MFLQGVFAHSARLFLLVSKYGISWTQLKENIQGVNTLVTQLSFFEWNSIESIEFVEFVDSVDSIEFHSEKLKSYLTSKLPWGVLVLLKF